MRIHFTQRKLSEKPRLVSYSGNNGQPLLRRKSQHLRLLGISIYVQQHRLVSISAHISPETHHWSCTTAHWLPILVRGGNKGTTDYISKTTLLFLPMGEKEANAEE